MIGAIVFALWASFMNRVRGGLFDARGVKGARWWAATGIGVGFCVLSGNWLAGLAVAIGFLLWAIKGWGLYFAAATGRWDFTDTEIEWIDRIGIRLFPAVTGRRHASNFKRGILCMGLRGGVFSLPLFTGLALTLNSAALAVWPLMFLQGFAYFAFKNLEPKGIDPTGHAEWLWGACMGAMIATTAYLW